MNPYMSFGNWGVQPAGLAAFAEFVRIFKTEIPEDKFVWESFFGLSPAGGWGPNQDRVEEDLLDPARVLLACLKGDENWCGSHACVAGWSVTTHPHLLTWVPGVGLTRTMDAIRSYQDYDTRRAEAKRVGEKGPLLDSAAFAWAFGIKPDEADAIIYGYDHDREDLSDRWWDLTAKQRAELILDEVAQAHKIEVTS